MALRFCMLQAHYRSPIDFSNKGLQDAEKAYSKLSEIYVRLKDMEWSEPIINPPVGKKYSKDLVGTWSKVLAEEPLRVFEKSCIDAMNDDLIPQLFYLICSKFLLIINKFSATGNTGA